ncbi:MAG TPA: 4-hydroxy-tetrahydrodipicolinate reductase [Muricauda sp.]|uniref:4-hydroxy-tetrahydrodipicolinate reductase n=1 Tax=Flagellimonas aurea TaxID=2915619 RepID=A0ABS3G2F9_9FLAO|nr:4-hydroxy-tetrahydrodipicolinate reductase [Allomuricauda aurea]MAO18757.1 4-hydroxy-tetrahydrodipicolinate reductase [Allomuricauda sp.]MBO0353599.1 4-hydroxy-tetrahydrodipicolinate reductase [Allomuricauda aurea]UBZ14672.1 4-hydroxy-tetrahydrodipicolinate reductase [Allomuricauda aquimarina]HBU78860.1 4-hydroxy-tetrahydrodipicolinate reductase [Allomuricauda sp.]
MKIGLFGYGKMGKMIEQIAQDRGHTIVAKIDDPSQDVDYSSMDVAIDFSTPEAAFDNITNCFKNNVPVISGTTGWLDKYSDAIKICEDNKSAFIYASNFSLGVNIFFELNKQLAKMMAGLNQYKVGMEEIHHTQKLDAPSGTAITLAEGIIENTAYENWKLDESSDKTVSIKSIREGMVPGTHSIAYASSVDTIEIKHEAHNREGFALGAVIASEWIQGKTGVFSMKDVLNLS